jgi:two-component system sensor histidine kinase SenX3
VNRPQRLPYDEHVGIWNKRPSENDTQSSDLATSQISDSLASALLANEDESLVVLPGEIVVFQSEGIAPLGIVRDSRLESEELLALVRLVRRSHELKRGNIEIPRGPIGEGKRNLRVTASPLSDSDAILVYINDESEQQRIDAVRRDFVANVSHELKTPIGALMLLSEAVMGAKEDPQEVAKFAGKMQNEAKRLSELVQEIINLSRLQSHDPLASAYEVEIDEVVQIAISQSQSNAEGRQIEIGYTNNGTGVVVGNRDQLIMAIHNLIENAINYSPERTKVSVSTELVDGLIEIRVADQGIGIPESEQERIFERFYRVDPARSRETGGTGLGLSIVKHVAQNHGGEVKVWSKPGVGSTFALRLPRLIEPDEASDKGE